MSKLRLFRDIARENSFARAARNNHITQPAASVHIKKLERELGRTLFKRSPGNTQLTTQGLEILDDVKEILRLCDSLKINSSLHRGELEGHIRLATIHSIGMYELDEFLASFMKAHPRVSVHLEFKRFDDIYELLLQEKIDLGIVAYPEKRTNIESISYGSDELVLVCHRDHALAARSSITCHKLRARPSSLLIAACLPG